MQGVGILEVAEHTFVPAASALLADWGAEVIKIEHVERGDAMRGLASSVLAVMGTSVHVLAAAPVQYDEQPAAPRRAPAFNEQGDAILSDLGLDWDAIVDLKVRGVVA
jgi:crotonobetainyl-CoA:carnitine CoA-transferase CaiB-like acyl-CoA transferase